MDKIQDKPDRNRYNDRTVSLVQDCVNELLELAERHGIGHINFQKHPVDIPNATFNDDCGHIKWSPVKRVEFKEETIVIHSEDQTAYVDRTYGDYFDVAQSLPQIYAAVIDCIEDGIHEDERKGASVRTYQIRRDSEIVPSTVTCRMAKGIGIILTGFTDTVTKESLLRVATALTDMGFHLPGKRIEITISPVVSGSAIPSLLDTPIALAILMESGQVRRNGNCHVVGELRLDGTARYNPAIADIASFHAETSGREPLLIPESGNNDIPSGMRTFASLPGLISETGHSPFPKTEK